MNSFGHLMFTHALYLHQQLKKVKCYIQQLNCQSLISHERQIVQRLVSLYKFLAYIKQYVNNREHKPIDEKGKLKNTQQNIQYDAEARAGMNLTNFQRDRNNFEDKLKQKILETEQLWVQALQQIKIAIECSFINRHKFNKVAYLLVRFVEDKSKISLRHYLSNSKNEQNSISRLNDIVKSNDDYGCYNRNSFSQYIRKWSNCLSISNILRVISQRQRISQQLLNKMLINQIQMNDNPCMQYTPSVCTQFYKCWNCTSFFYQNTQIQSHVNCKNNYSDPVFFISDQETQNILQNINSNLLEEMYCRAANLQNGVILMGLNKLRLVDRMHNENKNTESDIINNLLLKHREEKLLYEKIYEVIGVQLQADEATATIRLESLLKNYSMNKQLTQKTIQEHKIEFIPVYRAKLGKRQAKFQKKKFVIKISLQFKSVQNCRLIYSRLQNVGFKQYHVFGEQLGNDSIEGRNLACDVQQVDKKTNRKVGIYQNKLYGNDIYDEILKNWWKSKNQKQKKKRLEEFIQGFLENIEVEEREQVEKNIYKRHGFKMQDSQSAQNNQGRFCFLSNYPIKCRIIEFKHVQQEQKKNESKQKIIYSNGQTQQNKYYYNNYYSYNYGYYQTSYEEQQYQQQVSIDPTYGLFYQKPPAQQPTLSQSSVSKANEHIFGQLPYLAHSHASILILSEKGRQEGLFEKFQQSLKNMNADYKISANVYEKISCTSSRHSLVISHNNKFEVLKQRMQVAVGQSKQIKLFNVKKQMMLLSQNKSKVQLAIEQLKMKFSLMYGTQFIYGFLDRKCVLKFEEKKQAVFAFILLQCLEMKCIFVNEGKIQSAQLYTT